MEPLAALMAFPAPTVGRWESAPLVLIAVDAVRGSRDDLALLYYDAQSGMIHWPEFEMVPRAHSLRTRASDEKMREFAAFVFGGRLRNHEAAHTCHFYSACRSVGACGDARDQQCVCIDRHVTKVFSWGYVQQAIPCLIPCPMDVSYSSRDSQPPATYSKVTVRVSMCIVRIPETTLGQHSRDAVRTRLTACGEHAARETHRRLCVLYPDVDFAEPATQQACRIRDTGVQWTLSYAVRRVARERCSVVEEYLRGSWQQAGFVVTHEFPGTRRVDVGNAPDHVNSAA